ncbi:MAG: hypothetical protein ACRDWD_08525 [Acidimicrobiia bacterium]
MRRTVALVILGVFLLYTGVFFFVYLARAFRLESPENAPVVNVYHGDNFLRALLVLLLFLIGEVFVVYLAVAARRDQSVNVRRDLWSWLRSREQLTGEPADRIAERAISAYRTRLEGGATAGSSLSDVMNAGD